MTNRTFLSAAAVSLLLGADPLAGAADPADAPAVRVAVDVARPGARIERTMYGAFFEDINLGADGGLYAELVKNRSFDFPDPLMGWSEVKGGDSRGELSVLDSSLDPGRPEQMLRIRCDAPGTGYGVANEGFRGIGVRAGEDYLLAAVVRGSAGWGTALRVELVGEAGQVLASARIEGLAPYLLRRSATLRPTATAAKAKLRVLLDAPGGADLLWVSLFPRKTWKDRPGGLRADLVQWLADLKPGFLRFPGGCIVEGRHLSTRYRWKDTIGAPEDRPLLINRWNDEFKHRPAPDYFQTFGLGFHEYFVLCEDIGAEPLPILNCGMACQFNSGELVPLEELDPFIQDALDLIEYANGPATSPWGAVRARMGHPEPFGLELLGIGNEQWGPQYIERYERFAKVLKNRHPEVRLVASAGPSPGDDRFRFLWEKLRELKADIVDEHCYDRPAWFLDSARRYDGYDRSGPKVFMGEYAAQSVKTVSPENRNDWGCALAEAAFMTGLERNADVVVLSSYAPLFAHEEGWQWRPDLIWFDNLGSYGSASYWVQQLFSRNRGDRVLPVAIDGQPPATSREPGLYACASRDEASGEVILKVVNSAAAPIAAMVDLGGAEGVAPRGTATVLAAKSLADENSMAEPRKVAPATSEIENVGASFRHEFPAWSLTVLRLATRS